LVQACELKRGEFRYIRDTLARKFGAEHAATDIEKMAPPAKTAGEAETLVGLPAAKKKVQVTKTANAAEFNTLPLPPLDADPLNRKKRKA
jgi:hypothetical protein